MRFLLAVAALITATTNAAIKDCNPASLFRPTELALTPDPPVRGQPVLMTVKFNNPGPAVDAGTVTTSVSLNGIPFAPSSEALCTNTVCPIPTGAADRSTSTTWPDNVSGKVVSKSVWTGAGGEALLCVQTSVAVGSSHSLRRPLNLTADFNETIAHLWTPPLSDVEEADDDEDTKTKQVAPWYAPLLFDEGKKKYFNDSLAPTDVLFL